MRRLSRSGAVGLVAAAAILAAGCGSTSLSLIQLRSRATGICTTADRRLQAIPPPRSDTGGTRFLSRGIAALAPEARQLDMLQPPNEARSAYTSAVRSVRGELEALQGALRALQRGQEPIGTFRALQSRLGPLEAQSDRDWQSLQIPACTAH